MHNDEKCRLSFIVPCKNEIANIGRLIESIDKNLPAGIYEVLIIDNGSTDGTTDFLLGHQVPSMFICPNLKTVAELRNFGYEKSNGDLIVFLDADVELSVDWYETLMRLWEAGSLEKTVSGSHVLEPKMGCFPRGWYDGGRRHMNGTHINTAHMIVSRRAFSEIGGFDGTLVSGEDFEFSRRAMDKGYQVVNYPELEVIHHGYPKNLTDFFNREMWHGVGDAKDIHSILSSKVALLSLVFSGSMFAALLLLLKEPMLTIFFLGISSLICIISAMVKYRSSCVVDKAFYCLVFSVYFFARFLTITKRIVYVWR